MVLRLFLLGAICSLFVLACEAKINDPIPVKTSELSPEQVAHALIIKQKVEFPKILKELQDNKKKVSHWIWWVFPTEKPGDSEPGPKTYVNLSNVEYIVSNANMDAWAQILEEINKVLKVSIPAGTPSPDIIPKIDHSRIHYALQFWLVKAGATTKKHPRFFKALSELQKYKWR